MIWIDRSGTANRILEAKEKQREKEKTDRATKRAKRYVLSSSSSRVIFPTPFYVLPPSLQLQLTFADEFMLPGHHQPHLLSPSPGLTPSQNRHPLAPIQRQSRRRIPIVHGHVQENGMRGVGGHEDAASHANHLVIETAVTAQVPGIDA
jgi:hypothetical protein